MERNFINGICSNINPHLVYHSIFHSYNLSAFLFPLCPSISPFVSTHRVLLLLSSSGKQRSYNSPSCAIVALSGPFFTIMVMTS